VLVAAADSQTDDDLANEVRLFRTSFRELLYQFLIHTLDTKRGDLVDKLARNDVLSSGERQRIKAQKLTSVRANSLMMIMRLKSAEKFDIFLTILGEIGQQSVANVVRHAVHSIGQTGRNPIHISNSKIALFYDNYWFVYRGSTIVQQRFTYHGTIIVVPL